MKRLPVLMVLGIFAMLLFLQISCATANKDQEHRDTSVLSGQAQAADEKSAVVEETQAAKESSADVVKASTLPSLLANKHTETGVACSDCHKESPPANDVPTAVCLTCHADYREVASSSIDPHNAHMEFSECGDCHHGHKISENQCLGCHNFSLQVP